MTLCISFRIKPSRVNMSKSILNDKTLTHEQHIKIISEAWMKPAVPTIHEALINNITPNMFCTHGKKTPRTVPSLACLKKRENDFKFINIRQYIFFLTYFYYFLFFTIVFIGVLIGWYKAIEVQNTAQKCWQWFLLVILF